MSEHEGDGKKSGLRDMSVDPGKHDEEVETEPDRCVHRGCGCSW